MPAQQTAFVSADICMKVLGLKTRRAVQDLASRGRLVKVDLPKRASARGKAPVAYTQESVDAEKQRRDAMEPIATPNPGIVATTPQAEAYRNLAEFLATLTTRLEAAGVPVSHNPPAIADDAYVTVSEAAEIVRMSAGWIHEQIQVNRLPYERTPRGGIRIRRGDLRGLSARYVGEPMAMTRKA